MTPTTTTTPPPPPAGAAAAAAAAAPSLRRWALANGFTINEHVCMRTDADGNRGLATTTGGRVRRGDVVLRIPWRCVFKTTSADADPHVGAVFSHASNAELPPAEKLALYIMYIKNNAALYGGDDDCGDGGGDAAVPWYEYIASFPPSYKMSLNFSADELDALQNPRKRDMYVEEQADVRRHFECVSAFVERHAAVFNLTPTTDYGFAAFEWAWLCVMTRSVYISPSDIARYSRRSSRRGGAVNDDGGGSSDSSSDDDASLCSDNIYAMIPYGDMMNHSGADAAVNAKFDERGDFVVTAARDYTANADAVTLSYGYYGNELLLRYYGFVLRENPLDTFVFHLWRPLDVNDDEMFVDSQLAKRGGGGGADAASVARHVAWLTKVLPSFDKSRYLFMSRDAWTRRSSSSSSSNNNSSSSSSSDAGSAAAADMARREYGRMREHLSRRLVYEASADGAVCGCLLRAALLKFDSDDAASSARIGAIVLDIDSVETLPACAELRSAYMWIVHLALLHLLLHPTTYAEDVAVHTRDSLSRVSTARMRRARFEPEAARDDAPLLSYTMACIVGQRAQEKLILYHVVRRYVGLIEAMHC